MTNVTELIGHGPLMAIDLNNPSAVMTLLVIIMCVTHLKMIMQRWEQMLIQPGPLK